MTVAGWSSQVSASSGVALFSAFPALGQVSTTSRQLKDWNGGGKPAFDQRGSLPRGCRSGVAQMRL